MEIISQCEECRRYKAVDSTCEAFPDGIPTEILLNNHDHRKPYKGDNGILFEPISEEQRPLKSA